MATVNLTSEFGLVIRQAALEQRGVSYRKLLDTMEVEAPLDVSEDLISFGPHFGLEAVTEFVQRLEALGLLNVDDFFVFTGEFPGWCGFSGFLKRDSETT